MQQTKNLKYTVYKDHKPKIDDLELRLRDLKEDHVNTEVKVESLENTLPKMVREMIDYYMDQKLTPIFDTFVKKDHFKEKMMLKLDMTYFNEYVK